MSKEQIEQKIREAEEMMFYIDMKDRWSLSDRTSYLSYKEERDRLKAMLEKVQ